MWRALQAHPFVFPRVYNLPMPLYRTWAHFSADVGEVVDSHSPLPHVFLNTERLARLRDFSMSHPLSSMSRLEQVGDMIQEEDRHRTDFNLARVRISKTWRRQQRDAARKDVSGAARADSAAKLLAVQDRLKEIGASRDEGEASQSTSMLQESPLVGVRWGNSPSAKFNYILNEVSGHGAAAN